MDRSKASIWRQWWISSNFFWWIAYLYVDLAHRALFTLCGIWLNRHIDSTVCVRLNMCNNVCKLPKVQPHFHLTFDLKVIISSSLSESGKSSCMIENFPPFFHSFFFLPLSSCNMNEFDLNNAIFIDHDSSLLLLISKWICEKELPSSKNRSKFF